jgi:hypothetical protein
MREMVLPKILPVEDKRTAASTLCRKRNRWLTGFFVSAIAGVCAGMAGLAISALWRWELYRPRLILTGWEHG